MTEKLKNEINSIARITELRLNEICNDYEKSPYFLKEMSKITESVRYSLMAGGKRIRPFLVFQFSRICNGNEQNALTLAATIEMVHTYSLIHDDLPCMDNDDYRRGKPTNHKVFGEATAVLAGDALLTQAFALIAQSELSDKAKVQAIKVLSEKAGILGMIGGQEIDIQSEGKNIKAQTLYALQSKKTGMLIEAACLLGCIAADCNEEICSAASTFARSFGLAFQITDDILDVEGTNEELGKNIGSDKKDNKYTFVNYLGLNGAKLEAKKHIELAKATINNAFDKKASEPLLEICDYILIRRN